MKFFKGKKSWQRKIFLLHLRNSFSLRSSWLISRVAQNCAILFVRKTILSALRRFLTGSAKARHGLVPVMNLEHGTVECLLSDYYAGDWVDALDEKKTTIDERKAIATSGAYALGRKSDALIIDALKTTKTEVGDGTTGLTKALILEAFAKLNSTDVPDDGQRFGIVGF